MTKELRRSGEPSGLQTRGRIWVVCASGLLAIVFAASVTVLPLQAGRSDIRKGRSADFALQQLADLRTSLADLEVFMEPHFAVLVEPHSAVPVPISQLDLANGAVLITAVPPKVQAAVRALTAMPLTGAARDVETAGAAFAKANRGLAPVLSGRPGAVVTAAIKAHRAAFARAWMVTSTAATQVRNMRDVVLPRGLAQLGRSRSTTLGLSALAAIAALSVAFVFGQRSRRQDCLERTRARRHAFEASLQQALDMSKVEPDLYRIVGKGFHESVPHLQVEMLIADSSRAHFHQTLSTGADGPEERSGCGVVSPLDCPATLRGHTLVFPTSSALNACPYLQDRSSGECSAACVPVSVAGKTVGVTHATGPDRVPPTESDVRYLEITSRGASERLAMIRAFEKSETQASSDPLTGLFNRRSLVNRVHELQQEGTSYAIAYGDLDHFKDLNDVYGHESGDQALRLFSRVLRDAVRPNDIASRYGGEEFVIVLPDCNTKTATGVLERVRERLALALTTGRVPAFTVSFGLAASGDADTFDEVVAVADQALHAAKSAGRNRVVVAVDSVDTSEVTSSA